MHRFPYYDKLERIIQLLFCRVATGVVSNVIELQQELFPQYSAKLLAVVVYKLDSCTTTAGAPPLTITAGAVYTCKPLAL